MASMDQESGKDGGSAAAASATPSSPAPEKPNAPKNDPSTPSAPSAPTDILGQNRAIISATATSAATSPADSRETSPIRTNGKPSMPNLPRLAQSRRSSQDVSPTRSAAMTGIPSIPSAAAVQRARSVTSTPDVSGDAARPARASRGSSGTAPLAALTPLRLKSPPPSLSASKLAVRSPRKIDAAPSTPSIVVNQATPNSATSFDGKEEEDNMLRVGLKSAGRGASGSTPLETVDESSDAMTATTKTDRSRSASKSSTEPHATKQDESEEPSGKTPRSAAESGNESAGAKSGALPKANDLAKAAAKRPPVVGPRKSTSQLNASKNKIASDAAQNMTVETEIVSSIPQVAAGGGSDWPSGRPEHGSIRPKPSSETIKPKKERRKTTRKAPSIHSGTASSKADIFEAKVASAVDEANSTDSEETFVYESNPVEPTSSRPSRFHSRTPSATSMVSQFVHHEGRPHHSVAGKKSMKFASNHANGLTIETSETTHSGSGTSRANGGTSIHHHHHIGRFGRGGGHTSLFATESPFHHDAKGVRTGNGGHLSPRVATPRSPFVTRQPGSSKLGPSLYDLEGEGADDERTPLVGSIRGRNRNSRRPLGRTGLNGDRDGGLCHSLTCFLVLGGLVGLTVAAVIMGIILCSQPLYDVRIKGIENVLVSEQEIMLDLHVHAINPNMVFIQISELDVNLFAKSKYAGTGAWWREQQQHHHQQPPANDTHPSHLVTSPSRATSSSGGIDRGTDPIDEGDAQVLLLGQVREFDAPLVFEASPFRHAAHSSTGEMRLAKPGNRTEDGGTDRWARVIQHPFELIVKGVLNYTLPISARVRRVAVSGNVTVSPSAERREPLRMAVRAVELEE